MKSTFVRSLLSTRNSISLLPLRLVVGLVFLAHGSQKLFGWFDGGGLEGTGQFFEGTLGLAPGAFWAFCAGFGEFLGGAFLILGLFTRVGAILIAGIMGTAILMVHREAFFVSEDGMEFALTLLAASIAFIFAGGGRLSLDRFFSRRSAEK